MKNKTLKEIVVPATLVILAVLLLNPMQFWMPDMMVMAVLVALLVRFGVFASFILRESNFDESDDMNRSLAGRNAFLSGSAVLMIGIVVQGYSHKVDPWLVVSLIVMILVKILTRFWNDRNLL